MLKENQMLKSITKFFSGEGSEEMKKTETQAELSAVEMAAQLKQAQEALSSQAADMTALTELVEELSAKVTQAQAELAAAEKSKADLIADAKAKQAAARKVKVEAVIGENEKAVKLLAATENMEDAQFEAVVSALAGSFEAEAKTEMFKEVGVAAEADAAKVVTEESAEMKMLKAKYAQSK